MNSPAFIGEAAEHYRAGRLDNAAEICRTILRQSPDDLPANHLLGVVYFRQGKNAAARELLAFASESPNATAEIHNNYGAVLNATGDQEGALSAFKRALAVQQGYADAYNNLGAVYRRRGENAEAIESFRRALALNPDLAEARSNLGTAYRDVIPAWHFAMMGDRERNGAYERAIARLVPGRRVLEIGTGAGLLAMMAARAGASSVITCEAVAPVADRAREIIAGNGLSQQITVVGKHSTQLASGAGIPQRAEVLVTEIFSSNLIDEGLLPTIEHANQHLLIGNAATIPAAASAMGYLIGGTTVSDLLFAGSSSGFDLSLFNEFAPPSLAVDLDGLPHDVLSADFTLLRLGLKSPVFPMGSRPVEIAATRSGLCAGVAQWIRLEFDAGDFYENRPRAEAATRSHWSHIIYRFPRLVRVNRGDTIRFIVRHDRRQISIQHP